MPDKMWRRSYLASHWSDFSGFCITSLNPNLVKPDSGLCCNAYLWWLMRIAQRESYVSLCLRHHCSAVAVFSDSGVLPCQSPWPITITSPCRFWWRFCLARSLRSVPDLWKNYTGCLVTAKSSLTKQFSFCHQLCCEVWGLVPNWKMQCNCYFMWRLS